MLILSKEVKKEIISLEATEHEVSKTEAWRLYFCHKTILLWFPCESDRFLSSAYSKFNSVIVSKKGHESIFTENICKPNLVIQKSYSIN